MATTQAAKLDPTRFVASIYANGAEFGVWEQWLDAAQRGIWFSRTLTALWAQCDARARKTSGELGAVDFDVATNSQGMEVKRLRPGRSRGTPRMQTSSRR